MFLFQLLTIIYAGLVILNRGFAGVGVAPVYVSEIALSIGLISIFIQLYLKNNIEKILAPIYGILIIFAFILLAHLISCIDELNLKKFSENSILLIYPFFIAIGFHWAGFYKNKVLSIIGYVYIVSVIYGFMKPLVSAYLSDVIKINGVSLFGIYGTYYLVLVPSFYYFFLKIGSAIKNVLTINVILCINLMAILIQMSRNAILSLIITYMILFFSHRRKTAIVFSKQMLIFGFLFFSISPIFSYFHGVIGKGQMDVDFYITSLVSIFDSDYGAEKYNEVFSGSRHHRLEMWGIIINNTLSRFQSLILGQGFNIDLVDVAFKNPHNSLVALFGRTGILGLTMWLVLMLYIFINFLKAYKRSISKKDKSSSDIFLFFILYYLISIQSMAFSVVLESPMLAVPFYILLGVGLQFVKLKKSGENFAFKQ